MTLEEFSNGFDTLVNSYKRFKDFDKQEILDSIEFDEFEKSFYLTRAQEEVVLNLYNGRNPYGVTFEGTEELRRYLEGLVKTKKYLSEDAIESTGVNENSVFFRLPEDIAFITLEQVIFDDELLGCYDGSVASVYPVTQDEYEKVKNNPFRGPTKYKVIRLDPGDNLVELVSKYKIGTYLLRYLSRPNPIVLEDLPNELTVNGENTERECELNPVIHRAILERAVQLAIRSKTQLAGNKE